MTMGAWVVRVGLNGFEDVVFDVLRQFISTVHHAVAMAVATEFARFGHVVHGRTFQMEDFAHLRFG